MSRDTGTTFPDESFDLSHKGPGVLSMANAGRAHTNGCQFFLTTARAPYLNNKYVAFGNVIDGMDVVNKIDKFGQPNGQPQAEVTVRACGQYVLPESISTAFRSTVSCRYHTLPLRHVGRARVQRPDVTPAPCDPCPVVAGCVVSHRRLGTARRAEGSAGLLAWR